MTLEKTNHLTTKIDQWAQEHWVTRVLTSHVALAFVYGLFLCLYELAFARYVVPLFPLILWAGFLFVYDLLIRRVWHKLPYWKVLTLFFISAAVTVVLNLETGLVLNVNHWIATVVPLMAFYPVCLLAEKDERKKALMQSVLGLAVGLFIASLIALGMYAVRWVQVVEFAGVKEVLGLSLYDPSQPEKSGVILLGIYEDSNHPACNAILMILYSMGLFDCCKKGMFRKKWANTWGKVFAVANFAVQICYFPLANSRGGWLSLGVSVFVVILLAGLIRVFRNRKALPRFAISAVAAVLCVGVVCAGILGVRTAISQVHLELTFGTPDGTVEAPDGDGEPNVFAPTTQEQLNSFQKPNEDGAGRLAIWKEALRLYTMKPVFGQNTCNNAYYAQQFFEEYESQFLVYDKAVHNSYIDMLLDYGIVGLVLLMAFFVLCAVSVVKKLWQEKERLGLFELSMVGTIVMTACCAMLLSCVFTKTTATYFVLLIAVGYLMAYAGDAKEGKEHG